MVKGITFMFKKLAKLTILLGRLFIVAGVVIIVLLSFFWDFSLQPLEIKTIYTLDVGLVHIIVAPEYCMALAAVLLFYVGYVILFGRKPSQRVESFETYRELKIQCVLLILLLVVGVFVTISVFKPSFPSSYFQFPDMSKGALALRIDAVIALLLLLIPFLIPAVYTRIRHGENSDRLE